ncbi:NnrS family protein [Paracoccus sp. (in: a-proteobacteria)]|uniref:NnrS family protein n=1 Tax=Paracoccus sp. TaxID=267 RepID=UPI003A83D1A3
MRRGFLFTAGWRVFFWAAGLWAVLSVVIWLIWLAIHAFGGIAGDMSFAMPPHLWHAHEMVFGYASAAMGGFFLTAVPTWTGARAAPERFIMILAGLWLAGRLAVWVSALLPAGLVAAVDLAFLPVLATKILAQLVKRPKPQNMMFLALLSLIWTGNLLMHLDWMGLTGTARQGAIGGLLGICALIATLGGRVTPAFTRNALLREAQDAHLPVSRGWLDAAGIALAILTALAALLGLPDAVLAALAVLAGAAAAMRLAGWRGLAMTHQPIVWSLHLAYAMLTLGLILWGLSLRGIGSEVAALHILGIGAVGGMTLAIMSRASLGHSGRALTAPRPVALAYGLIPVAVLLRWAGSVWMATLYYPAVLASGVVWCLAFGLYLTALWPVFFGPRLSRDESEAA